MAERRKPKNRHPFSKITDFDRAMRKLVDVPKDDVERRERESKTPRPKT